MIVDTFLYAGEADMLELRLRTMDEAVAFFCPVSVGKTHQGEATPTNTHPLNLADPRWAPWLPKLRPFFAPFDAAPKVTSRGGVGSADYQRIERWHRDLCRDAADRVPGIGVNDLVIVADVDEIIDPAVLAYPDDLYERLGANSPFLTLGLRFHSGALNLLHPHQPWIGPTISTLGRCNPQVAFDRRPEAVDEGRVIWQAGWHLSWFGDDAERARKLETFSHAELLGTFDPAADRMRHSNGEVLEVLTEAEAAALAWPAPLLDGSFTPPESWYYRPEDATPTPGVATLTEVTPQGEPVGEPREVAYTESEAQVEVETPPPADPDGDDTLAAEADDVLAALDGYADAPPASE